MARFQVTALDALCGATTLLELDASSAVEAGREVAKRGLTLLQCEQAAPLAASANRRVRWDVAQWAQELRTLLHSGMTVVEALETLQAQAPLGARSGVLEAVLQALRAGRPLSAAMTLTGAFPAILIAGVKASEKTSNLVSALDDYLRYHGMLHGLKNKVASSAVYPAVVAGVGLAVTLFLLAFVIPRFALLYAGQSGEVGAATQLLLWSSSLLTSRLPMLGAACAALCAAAWHAWRAGAAAWLAQWCLQRVPVLRRLRDEFRLARVYQSLALMVRGGYPLSDALQQCAELELGAALVPSLERTHAALLQGRGIAVVLLQEGLADVTDYRLLLVGERSGNFDEVLRAISQRHAASFASGIDRMTRLVEPLLLLSVSLLVGGIVVLMYMPVFDIAASIG